jgi:acyl dehydratase
MVAMITPMPKSCTEGQCVAATESDNTADSATPSGKLAARVGREFVSDWVLVDQAMIDAFADATGDHQFIHIDPVRAAQTPFGGTIAHGFLLLSLLPRLFDTMADLDVPGQKMGVNYGCDKLRFTNPVRSGSRVRLRMAARTVEEKRAGQFQILADVTMEIEGQERPAFIAEWISQAFF